MTHRPDLLYSATMMLAVLSSALLLRRTQRHLPLSSVQKTGIGIGAFCGAMVGAKLPFLFSDWEELLSGAAWLSDGKTIMLGIVGGYLGVEIAKWILEVRVKTGDSFVVPVALAVAIGRLACFRGGCCYGTPTDLPWGVVFATAGRAAVPRHPTQLYEAVFHAACGILAWQLLQRGLLRGQLIKLYILAYLGFRFASEWIRPETRLWLNLTGYQWAALGAAPLFIWLWYRDHPPRH